MCIFTFTLNNLNWNVIIMGSISIFFQWIQIKWKSWARTKLPNFHSFPLLFFLLGSYNRSVAPETIRPSGLCVRVNGTGVKRQRESGAGSWVKGGADPGGARGVVVAVQIAGGGVGLFLVTAPVLIETSDVTKTRLTGREKGAAVTEQLHSASLGPLSPLTSRSFIPLSRCISLRLMVGLEVDGSSFEV